MRQNKKRGYTKELARQMYVFFISFDEAGGAPSFLKFAKAIGVTLAELQDFRSHKTFDAAYRACSDIRRDYLIDRALTKRFDPSLVKFLLTSEFGMGEASEEDRTLDVTLQVVS